MATTTGGSTYVTSTDLVANYPTASLALANRVDLVASGQIVYNTSNYTVTVADILGGKTIVQNSAGATTVTLPSSSLVDGMQAKISNVGAGTVTVAGGTLLGTTTISQYGGITAVYKTSITSWWLLPFSGSVGAANFTNTATGTYTGYKYVTFTGNGTLVIDKAGKLDFCIVGGGGGSTYTGGWGGGHGGQVYRVNDQFMPAGSYTVTIGGGGATSANGGASSIGSITALGGYAGNQNNGNSGNGGAGSNNAPGAGSNGTNGTAGTAGLTTSLTNTTLTFGGGGGGGSNAAFSAPGGAGGGGNGGGYSGGSAGTTNTGGGGGGSYAGGSGIIIVRVAV